MGAESPLDRLDRLDRENSEMREQLRLRDALLVKSLTDKTEELNKYTAFMSAAANTRNEQMMELIQDLLTEASGALMRV